MSGSQLASNERILSSRISSEHTRLILGPGHSCGFNVHERCFGKRSAGRNPAFSSLSTRISAALPCGGRLLNVRTNALLMFSTVTRGLRPGTFVGGRLGREECAQCKHDDSGPNCAGNSRESKNIQIRPCPHPASCFRPGTWLLGDCSTAAPPPITSVDQQGCLRQGAQPRGQAALSRRPRWRLTRWP